MEGLAGNWLLRFTKGILPYTGSIIKRFPPTCRKKSYDQAISMYYPLQHPKNEENEPSDSILSFFFLTLRIGGKTPFKHTTHSRTPAMLTIEKLPLNNWISSPTGINRMQTLIFTKGNALPHSIKFDKSPIFFLEADRFTDYFPANLSRRHPVLHQVLSATRRLAIKCPHRL